MQIGAVGVPHDLAVGRDFDAIFAEMSAAGMSLFMPMSVYEELPAIKATGYETAFFPPPFGTATAAFYDSMREHGIKMIVPASLVYPIGAALPSPENDPLVALIAAAGRDLIEAVYTYDEPVKQGVPVGALQAVYQHVKGVAPDLPVIQVNAAAEAGEDMDAYLAAVTAAAEWADQIGFSIYGTALEGAGQPTPYSGGEIVGYLGALADYARWIEETLPDKLTIGVLQGFGLADLFSDELLAQYDPAVIEAAAAPDILTMSEAARVFADAETVMWFGPSYHDSSLDAAWQDILDVTASLDTELRPGVGPLGDLDAADDAVSEVAGPGAAVGILLGLARPQDETPSFGVDDSRFAVTSEGRVVLIGSLDHETEPEVTLTAWARLSDGRIATQSFVLAVEDVIEEIRGTWRGEELVGGNGADAILRRGGNDELAGRAGADRIDGGSGSDVLLGEAGDDTLIGGNGADTLSGGAGDDRLTGGAQADVFVFRGDEGYDVITDFTVGKDKIGVVGYAPLGLAFGAGGFALVSVGDTEILLEGVHPSTLSMNDVVFLAEFG